VRRLFLDSIRCGILCEGIPLFKNSVRKRRNNFTSFYPDAAAPEIGAF
jgi:hypothetical protein